MKVLIIGGVAAGTKTAAKLKRADRGLEVTILTKDQEISYAGCGLPYYVGGAIEDRADLVVNTPQQYEALTGVRVLVGREAVALEPKGKVVTAQNLQSGLNEQYPYDKLVIATGCHSGPRVPAKQECAAGRGCRRRLYWPGDCGKPTGAGGCRNGSGFCRAGFAERI